MRFALLALSLFLAVPVYADDVPPMPPDVRAKFDKAMAKLWHSDCGCWRFVFRGRMRELSPPLSESDRWLVLRVIEDGEAIPIAPNGSGT